MTQERQLGLCLGPTSAPAAFHGGAGADSLPQDGPIKPRPYQSAAIDALFAWWAARPGQNPLVVLPTAAGKTVVFALLLQRLLSDYPKLRALVLAHRQELLDQAEKKLLRVWPEAPTGIYCAALGRRQIRQVTIASRDSLAHLSPEELGRFDIVIVDEAHRVGEDLESRYQVIFENVRAVNPQSTIVGFSATPYRTDSGPIYGEDRPFAGVAYEQTIRAMIREGYLAEVRSVRVKNQIDTKGLRTVAGDFSPKQLGERAVRGDLLDAQLKEWLAVAALRRCSIFFCVNVDHAELVSERLLELGKVVPALHGKTPRRDREEILGQLERGEIDGVANVGVLTEGFDCPRLDCIALLRPTKSLNLFVQMVGRGLRLSPETGKEDCLLLDFGGCLNRFGPIDRARPEATGRAGRGDRVKVCPMCETEVATAARECPHCEHKFGGDAIECERCGADNPMSAMRCEACGELLNREGLEATASRASAFSWQTKGGVPDEDRDVHCHEVQRMEVSVTTAKKTGRQLLRIGYLCGLEWFSEVYCLNYPGFAGDKAIRELRKRLLGPFRHPPLPRHTTPAQFEYWHQSTPGGLLKTPRAVYVDHASRWNEIVQVEDWTERTLAAVAAVEAAQPAPGPQTFGELPPDEPETPGSAQPDHAELLRLMDDEIPF